MELTFQAVSEQRIGPEWERLFRRFWPAYRQWFLGEGIDRRPTYAAGLRRLRADMPELIPTYEAACEAAGGGDLEARCLGLWCPPAYVTGCSQVVWVDDEPMIIRNYDYAPAACEGVLLHSSWNGRQVMATTDCLWGALDGVNEDGLAASLTFGGRQVVGEGFGIPLIVRYVLEVCADVPEACAALQRLPSHMAYNVTVVDRAGRFATAYLAPDRETVIRQVPVAANHQGRIDWHNFARATATLERERFLYFRLQDSSMTTERLIDHFLKPPLYTRAYANGFGTIYTAVYRPATGEATFIWPGKRVEQSLRAFRTGQHRQRFDADTDTDTDTAVAGPVH